MSKAFVMAMAERLRQVNGEGFDAAHDDAYSPGTLAAAGECYARAAHWSLTNDNQLPPPPMIWPWHATWWKPSTDPKRNIEKAMALLAAEYDRLERAEVADTAEVTLWSTDDEWQSGMWDDLLELIEDRELLVGATVYVGTKRSAQATDFTVNLAESVIENMQVQAEDDFSEVGEGYPDVPKEQETILQSLIDAWATVYAEPDFYGVANVREYTITEEDLSL